VEPTGEHHVLGSEQYRRPPALCGAAFTFAPVTSTYNAHSVEFAGRGASLPRQCLNTTTRARWPLPSFASQV